jgi:hypothetical protein
MHFLSFILVLLPSLVFSQADLDAFKKDQSFEQHKKWVAEDIAKCKSTPAECKISTLFMVDDFSQTYLRKQAKAKIRQIEFQKKNPSVKGDKLKQEFGRIASEVEIDYAKHENENTDKTMGYELKDNKKNIKDVYYFDVKKLKAEHRKLYGATYEAKPYYDDVPGNFQAAIDQHILDMKTAAKEIKALGFEKYIEGWGNEMEAVDARLSDMLPAATCKEEAIRQLLKLFKDDKENILGKQFELTAIKTALLLKKDAGHKATELKSLEGFVNQKQKEFASDDKIGELKKIYAQEAKQVDIKRLEGMTAKIKKGEYNYYNSETRILNSDVSAFYLLMDNHQEEGVPAFGVEDAAVAWAFGSLASQIKDKKSPEYSKINLSNQVNKLMSPKVAGGTDTPVKELEKMQISSETEIDQALKETLKSQLSPECLAELNLNGESCDASLVDLKSEAFGQMMKEITAKYDQAEGPNAVAGYYGEVKDFIAKISVNPPLKKADKVTPENPGKKYTQKLFNGWPYEKAYFDSKDRKERLYNQIQQYKFLKEKVKCEKDNKKCWKDKSLMLEKALTIRTTNEKFPKGVECLKLKEIADGQMLFVGEVDCK